MDPSKNGTRHVSRLPRSSLRALLAVSLLFVATSARADDFSDLPLEDPAPAKPAPGTPATSSSPAPAASTVSPASPAPAPPAITVTLPSSTDSSPPPQPPAPAPAAAAAPAPPAAAPAPPAAAPAPSAAAAPPAAAAPAAPPPPANDEPSATTAEEGFRSRTSDLELQVSQLAGDVQKTKFRLMGLSEQILGSGMTNSGAKLAVWHRNELGSSYVITGIVYVLDGAPIYTKVDDSGDLGSRDEFVIFESRVVPGPHQLAVQYDLRGHGYGVFSYLEDLHLTLRKSLSFNVEPGKVTRISGTAYEKGQITLEFKDRPDINFEETVTKEVLKPAGDSADKAADKASGADK